MVAIVQVLPIDLPVGRHALAHVAQNLDVLAEQPVEHLAPRLTDVILQGLDVGVARAEDHARMGGDLVGLKPVVLFAERLRHAALAL